MTRLFKYCVLLSGMASCLGLSKAQDNFKSLEARITTLETRLRAIESKVTVPPPAVPDHGGTTSIETFKDQSYVIREGDTIGGVARKFEIPRQALLEANNLAEGEPIYVGETLALPAAAPVSEPVAVSAEAGQVHVVQAGDTLMGLSRRYHTTIDALKDANALKSDVIGTGQKLVILKSQSGASVAAPKSKSENNFVYDNPLLNPVETYGEYTVVPSDNLYALARDFFTTLPELQRLNNLGNSSVIKPGQVLIVPTSKYNAYHRTASAY